MTARDDTLLNVQGLRVYYWTDRGPARAVENITFTVNRKERFGLVGESGCGKSTTAMSILRLIKPPGSIESGHIMLEDTDLLALSREEMREVRWSRIALIPQGAMNSLNPVMRIKDQITDAIMAHEHSLSGEELDARVRVLLSVVELPGRVARMYPHELSGGMKQRVCIAMATALNPQLIIADEPTSALDVVVQRAVMQMLIEVQERLESSLILIGHDMGLIAQAANRLAVMYAGKIAEVGEVHDMFGDPLHPYTQLLISSLPSPKEKKERQAIPGLPPNLIEPPPGCLFHPRCPYVMDVCRHEVPELLPARPGRLVACHLYD